MASGTGANFGELKGFYEQWNATLNTDVKEQAAFSALSKENKAIVLLAFQYLSEADDAGLQLSFRLDREAIVPITKEQLDGVVNSLKKQFSFKAILTTDSTDFSAEKATKSYNNIMRMQHLLSTPEEKEGVRQAAGKFKDVYGQRKILRAVLDPEFITTMMDGIDIPAGTTSSEVLFKKMENWAKAHIRKGDFQDAALQIIKDLRESEKGGELNRGNFEDQIKIFQDRLALAFAELSPKLTSADLEKLEETGTKGASHLKLVRDCFIDFGKVFISPLQKAVGVVVDAKGTYNSVRDGIIKLIAPNKIERLIATFKEVFHQITTAPLESLGVVGRGPFESARAQNG